MTPAERARDRMVQARSREIAQALAGLPPELSEQLEHVLEQARHVLETQDVVNLHATPPLVEAIARDDSLVDVVNSKIRYLLLSGAHVDMDTLDLLRQIFPDTAVAVAFGSTMVLSQAATRIDGDSIVFDPRSPYVVFWVIDPDSGNEVAYGERGQVVMNHISKGMFIPNNLERDTAIRMPGPDGQVGDSISEVAPALAHPLAGIALRARVGGVGHHHEQPEGDRSARALDRRAVALDEDGARHDERRRAVIVVVGLRERVGAPCRQRDGVEPLVVVRRPEAQEEVARGAAGLERVRARGQGSQRGDEGGQESGLSDGGHGESLIAPGAAR